MSDFYILLENFCSVHGEEEILTKVFSEIFLPKMEKMKDQELFTLYLNIIAFPPFHGKIILKKMIEFDLLDSDFMRKEVNDQKDLPEWIQKILK